MKVLTIHQPWASLVMIGAKPNEFRRESYLNRRSYRNGPQVGERVVVHAAARPMKVAEVADMLNRLERGNDATGLVPDLALDLLNRIWGHPKAQFQMLPLGAGLGTAILGKPELACDLFKLEVADSDRGQFNWAWPLSDIVRWDAPVPMRGMQGFWEWEGQYAPA